MADAPDLGAALAEAMRTIEHLQHAVESRQRVGEAVGILMERYGLDRESAFAYLVRTSSHTNVKLRDVAAGVVADAVNRSRRSHSPVAATAPSQP